MVREKAFGERMRGLRTEKQLTLTQLAKLTKRSVSLLSQIEAGKVSPSFSSMRLIADALEVPLGRLIADREPSETGRSSLVSPRDRKVLTTQGGVQHQLLSRSVAPPFEFISVELPPRSSTGESLYTHEGVECGLLLEGALEIQVGRKTYHLKPGDSITLDSSIPHNFINRGKRKARAVWVNSTPMIFSTR
ncbi:MAG TPA: cupin domain-containing protein [Candidatus Sulfotelmatobacter sp.]|nr:cupin domain-containing protein [Candidatus Sulfotelmatobacter sp.]